MKKRNLFLAVALIALMTGVLSAQTYDSESDFEVTKSGNAITIDAYVGKKTAINIPPRIQNTPVTAIGNKAFMNSTITSVTIPNGVTKIGQSAFSGCKSLTSVTIPNGVTSIGSQAFFGCTSLVSVTIPNSVTSIVAYAFNNCTSLTSVTFQGTIPSANFESNAPFPGDLRDKYFAAGGGAGTYTRPNGTSTTWTAPASSTPIATQYDSESDFQATKTGNAITITRYAGSKTTVNIPPTIQNLPVTSIGNNAFLGIKSTIITIPQSVTSIGNSAFAASSITEISIPNNVKNIENSAFENCTSLKSVTIGSGVTSMGSGVFRGCTSLISVTFQGAIPSASFSSSSPFQGDLRAKFYATNTNNGTAGTYTTTAPVSNTSTWTKK